jgi:hypothetical protein
MLVEFIAHLIICNGIREDGSLLIWSAVKKRSYSTRYPFSNVERP